LSLNPAVFFKVFVPSFKKWPLEVLKSADRYDCMYKPKSYFFMGDAVYGFQQWWEHVIVWDINFKSCLPVLMIFGESGMLKAISATSNSFSLDIYIQNK
jgi:hypothetical protein